MRAISVEKISILISIVQDFLPDLITKNHRLLYDVEFFKMNAIYERKYDVYIDDNSLKHVSYSLRIAILSSSTSLSLAIDSVSYKKRIHVYPMILN